MKATSEHNNNNKKSLKTSLNEDNDYFKRQTRKN
jgi:hypothetical protein